MNKRAYGFTIVELLIVIVVIGILAAVSVVAYSGISNQANDNAVKADLSDFRKKIEMFRVSRTDQERYPDGSSVVSELASLGFRASKGSYSTGGSNLMYCHGSNGTVFILSAVSKSGKIFTVSSTESVKEAPAMFTACATAPYNSNYRGYAPEDTTTGPWRAWANGG